jgi:LacI family transcriptional regulator, xylobiose transport system transcriptional regulator
VPIDPRFISHGRFHVEEGIETGRALLALSDRPTAIFAGNDLQALGVYQAAREARLHIPEDLSVVGFDDLPVAQWVGPPLTTIRQPLFDMATVGAEMVLAIARGEEPAQTRIELATELIIRESTAPPRALAGRPSVRAWSAADRRRVEHSGRLAPGQQSRGRGDG